MLVFNPPNIHLPPHAPRPLGSVAEVMKACLPSSPFPPFHWHSGGPTCCKCGLIFPRACRGGEVSSPGFVKKVMGSEPSSTPNLANGQPISGPHRATCLPTLCVGRALLWSLHKWFTCLLESDISCLLSHNNRFKRLRDRGEVKVTVSDGHYLVHKRTLYICQYYYRLVSLSHRRPSAVPGVKDNVPSLSDPCAAAFTEHWWISSGEVNKKDIRSIPQLKQFP